MEAAVRGIFLRAFRIFRNPCTSLHAYRRCLRNCNTSVHIYNDGDPAPIFFSENVQKILKQVTGLDTNKVFKRRYDERTLKTPKYEFLTNEELESHTRKAKRKAQDILQMPPVVKERQVREQILSRDPAITGFDTSKYIFTDITFGVSDRKRVIIVRDLDGTLRQATWEERDRMNLGYNPRPGGSLNTPKVFQEENLSNVLERKQYLFVLDRACAQFEPDDPEYQRVSSTVYETIDHHHSHISLHSTRHYGPLCFYLAWHCKIDTLLLSLIQEEMVADAAAIVQLYQLIHQDLKSVNLDTDNSQHLEYIKKYIEEDCLQRAQLQLAVQAYQELQHSRQQHNKQLIAAHGL